MKQLFVTDLDGTFLTPDAQVTKRSAQLINQAVERGCCFTFATARTASSAVKIMKNVRVNVPCILMNGVSIFDTEKGKYVKNEFFTGEQALQIARIFKDNNVIPFMYSIENETLYTYYYGFQCKEMHDFFMMRGSFDDRPFVECKSLEEKADDSTVYFSVQGRHDDLKRVSDILSAENICSHAFYKDVYNKNIWFLEVFSKNASKSNGVKFLKEYGGFDTVTCFGDNLNDLPMFEVSDRKIAVSNAKDELRSAADEIIGDNEHDSVAVWINERN